PGQSPLRWSSSLCCSLTCRPLGAAEKPGACPAAAPEGLIAPCSFPCLEDEDCVGAQKCCPLGCGFACLEPAQGKGSAGTAGSLGPPRGPSVPQTLPPWPLGKHTKLPLHRQLLAAAGKTHPGTWPQAPGICGSWQEPGTPRAGRAASAGC
uniref:WAP domain-containing protein n=1 Tax=Malurus cyaneus samueli TaxID=2593467 RepID=A0A8C5TPG2_9PASS